MAEAKAKAKAKDAEESEESDEEADVRPEDDVEMTFFEHLGELRTRLIRALWAFIPTFGLGWYFRETLFDWFVVPWSRAHQTETVDVTPALLWNWVTHPVGDGTPVERVALHYTGPMDTFVGFLIISAIFGLVTASPWVFYQLWGFISPGLYRREKRLALPFVLSATGMFIIGMYFGFSLVLPLTYDMLGDFAGDIGTNVELKDVVTMDEYLTFTAQLLVAFGITFVVPVVITFLSFAGLINWKQLVKFGRWWLLISVVIAAILTPPDAGSQLMMAIPLNLFYWVGVVLSWMFGPKVPKAGATTEDGFER